MLVRGELSGGAGDRALGVMDIVARSKTDGDLSANSLTVRYRSISGEAGEEHYRTSVSNSRPAPLIASTRDANLRGSFFDLTSGHQFQFDSLSGRYILLDFWAMWCKPCVQEMPALKDFAASHSNEVIVVAISADPISSSDDSSKGIAFIKQMGIQFKSLWDSRRSSLTKQYGALNLGLPRKFLINP